MGNEKIDQVDSLTYLYSIISKDGEYSEDVRRRIIVAEGIFTVKMSVGRIGRLFCGPRSVCALIFLYHLQF